MRPITLESRWAINRKALLYGLAAGMLWGFLTAASGIPPEWLVYDEAKGVIYKYLDEGVLSTVVEADGFFTELNTTLVKVILTLLALVGLAGWATWQLARIRPRGEKQPSLRYGLDWHLIGLAAGGLICAGLFRILGLDIWFKGALFTPARVVIIVLNILLPLYLGVSLFLVWFLRLKPVPASNQDVSHHKSTRKSANRFWFKLRRRKKGGDSANS